MQEKINFLKKDFHDLLLKLSAEDKGRWGLMNAQQMVEHMTDTFRIANGKEFQKIELDPERVIKVRSFFLSDKPFRENTSNHLLPAVPNPFRNGSMDDARDELQRETNEFFASFENNSERSTINPFAGSFKFEEWIQLLHKHATHHLIQFGLIESS